jgi:hypothetical protein
MAAPPSRAEEITIATPITIIICNGMWIICSIYRNGKSRKPEPTSFLGIPFGFLNLANHAIVHGWLSPFEQNILGESYEKARVARRVPKYKQLLNCLLKAVSIMR